MTTPSVVKTMIERADQLGHTEPEHYLWCASQHHKLDPTKPAAKWDTAWRACAMPPVCRDCGSTICGTRS